MLLRAYHAEATHVRTEQLDEMMIGIKAMKFQRLHMTILVLKKCTDDAGRLVAAARDALELLSCLISTSAQVYNGVVW